MFLIFAPRTIKVWRDGACVQTLEGHEGPVLCVAVLPDGKILSGSVDTMIRVWADGKCIHVIRSHSDSVRYVHMHIYMHAHLHACSWHAYTVRAMAAVHRVRVFTTFRCSFLQSLC